ncbi:DUF6116 family protein [Marilutibacter aestuarii]
MTMATSLLSPLFRFVEKLSYPKLFLVTAAVFVVDLFVPDMVPFADELLLGLATLLLSRKRKDRGVTLDADRR